MVEGTKVEIKEMGPVGEGDLEGVPERDALFVASHTWALEAASLLTVEAANSGPVTAPFATAAALVAMKLHAIEGRRGGGVDKRASDAWDLYRLFLDLDARGEVCAALAVAPSPLPELVRSAPTRAFVDGAVRTRPWLRQGDREMASVGAEELRLMAQRVLVVLT